MAAENIYNQPPIMFSESSKRAAYNEKVKARTDKLLEATEARNVTEFMVKLIYGEDFQLPVRLLDTKVEASHGLVPELIDAVGLIDSYNDFRGGALAETLRYFHEQGYVMDVRFGREGSPVVYVKPPFWTHQASNSTEHNGRRVDDAERAKMLIYISEGLKELNPDELSVDRFYEVRAWWD